MEDRSGPSRLLRGRMDDQSQIKSEDLHGVDKEQRDRFCPQPGDTGNRALKFGPIEVKLF